MDKRRTYLLPKVVLNGRDITQVVIDPHYELKHKDINDALILELVRKLDGLEVPCQEQRGEWQFFVLDRMIYRKKRYRLILCMLEDDDFIGVINCFRR